MQVSSPQVSNPLASFASPNNLSLPELPRNIAQVILDFVPPQNALERINPCTPEETALVNSFRQLTDQQLCSHYFGTLPTPLTTPPDDESYATFLKFCHPSFTSRVPIPVITPFPTPKGLWNRVKTSWDTIKWACGVENTVNSTLDQALAKTTRQLNILKNYKPQNLIQLRNLHQTYFNLEKHYNDHIISYGFFSLYSYSRLRFITRLFLRFIKPFVQYYYSSVKDLQNSLTYEEMKKQSCAVVGGFIAENRRYEVRAFLPGALSDNEARFAIYPEGPSRHLNAFYVAITKRQVINEHFLKIDPAFLIINVMNTNFNEKLVQIMIEVLNQVPQTEDIEVSESFYKNGELEYINAGFAYRTNNPWPLWALSKKALNVKPVRFSSVSGTWDKILKVSPILYASGGMLPE